MMHDDRLGFNPFHLYIFENIVTKGKIAQKKQFTFCLNVSNSSFKNYTFIYYTRFA